jgi:hypothetical protein
VTTIRSLDSLLESRRRWALRSIDDGVGVAVSQHVGEIRERCDR